MRKPDTWMPLYVADYLGDTGHLRVHEHGAYLLMLMHYWRNGPLPDDDRFLSGLARMTPEQWAECSATIRAFFEPRDGRLHQKRIDQELSDAKANSDKKRDAANKRWEHQRGGGGGGGSGGGQSTRTPDGDAHASANASPPDRHTHMHPQCPSPSPKEEDSVPNGTAQAVAAAPPPMPPDPLWSEGLPSLIELTGLERGRAAGLMGRLLKNAGDDRGRVLDAIRRCQAKCPFQPTTWLLKAVLAPARSQQRPQAQNGAIEMILRAREEGLNVVDPFDEEPRRVVSH